MRASAYYFQAEPYCWVCGKMTEENIEVSAADSDLAYPAVRVPIHPSCHSRKISANIFLGAAAFAFCAAGLTVVESFIFGYFAAIPRVFARFSPPPAWLVVITMIFSALAGFVVFTKAYFSYMDFINREIRLHTMPAD
jgi:hypothetical protein